LLLETGVSSADGPLTDPRSLAAGSDGLTGGGG